MIDFSEVVSKVPGLGEKEEVASDDEIRFYCDPEDYGAYPPPTPAHKDLPDWFKNVPRDLGGGKSAKACQPFYDSMSRGWLLKTPVDLEVRVAAHENRFEIRREKNQRWLSTQANSVEQLGEFPGAEHLVLFQLRVPWIAETADGYSTMILPALNRPDPRFRSFSGIVDTDKYPRILNSVCMWTMPRFEGVIERGTPIATVLPVKRDEFGKTASVRRASETEQNRHEALHTRVKDTHIDQGYQKEVWEVKPTQETTYEGDMYDV